ncbi:hypothetical protein B0H19DRAFT_236732 [Mycena capillaripes]|nr:hypothetical protein B0H19DRAFT_236732 [Mycena capillaripes]
MIEQVGLVGFQPQIAHVYNGDRSATLRLSLVHAFHVYARPAPRRARGSCNQEYRRERALCICGLVCRTWLTLTRPILFQRISLRVGTRGRANAHAFAILFRRRDRATFLPFVKEIEIVGQHLWTHSVLPRLVCYLPGFRTLRLPEGYYRPRQYLRHLKIFAILWYLPPMVLSVYSMHSRHWNM